MKRILAAALGLAFAALAGATALPAPIVEQLRAADIPLDAVGVLVQRASDGATVLSHGADRSLQPASTIKLVTSLVALEKLGPAYRGSAEMRVAGEVSEGVLQGGVYLRGLGDVDFDWAALERMLHRLRSLGVREIRGDLVLDLGFFRPARTDVGVAPFDEAPEFRYNVIPDALALNMNLAQLDLVAEGSGVRASLMTPLDGVSVVSQMTLSERDCDDWEDGWVIPLVERLPRGQLRIRLRGDFPRQCSAVTAINVIDRVQFAERLFRALWTRLGGTFSGKAREGETPAETRFVAEHRSRPLSLVVHDINKRSDNPVTRVMFLTLGALSDPTSTDSTARRADAEIRGWMERRGIDTKGLVLENGSGLSRLERITATQLAGVLKAAQGSDWAPEFASSLPIVAVDGAMRKRLRGTPAERSRIKTGTLRDATAVAGYVKDAGGTGYIFVATINHAHAKRRVARPIVDALIDWVAKRR